MSEFQTNVNTLDLEALKALLPPMKQDGFVVRGADAKVERIKVPIPGPDECYVKVLIAGVCNTDLEIMKGYMGLKASWATSSWACARARRTATSI